MHTLEAVYCSGYLPYKFLPANETFVFAAEYLNAFIMLALNIGFLLFSEVMRRRSIELCFHANTLGDWSSCHSIRPNVEEWKAEKTYSKGEIVTFKGTTWRSRGFVNTAEPGKFETYCLY